MPKLEIKLAEFDQLRDKIKNSEKSIEDLKKELQTSLADKSTVKTTITYPQRIDTSLYNKISSIENDVRRITMPGLYDHPSGYISYITTVLQSLNDLKYYSSSVSIQNPEIKVEYVNFDDVREEIRKVF